jgi:hypothetical protein
MYCASLISRPLTNICNHSLFAGIFPDCLKISVVRPLYKNGNKAGMSKLQAYFIVNSKVLGKVMHNRFSHYLQNNNVLVPE